MEQRYEINLFEVDSGMVTVIPANLYSKSILQKQTYLTKSLKPLEIGVGSTENYTTGIIIARIYEKNNYMVPHLEQQRRYHFHMGSSDVSLLFNFFPMGDCTETVFAENLGEGSYDRKPLCLVVLFK